MLGTKPLDVIETQGASGTASRSKQSGCLLLGVRYPALSWVSAHPRSLDGVHRCWAGTGSVNRCPVVRYRYVLQEVDLKPGSDEIGEQCHDSCQHLV